MAELTMNATCTMADDQATWYEPDPGPLTACGEPAIALISIACVHEHLNQAIACTSCAADIQRAAGLLTCRRCETGPYAHECKVTFEIRWVSGEVTRG